MWFYKQVIKSKSKKKEKKKKREKKNKKQPLYYEATHFF